MLAWGHSQLGAAFLSRMPRRSGQSPGTAWLMPRRKGPGQPLPGTSPLMVTVSLWSSLAECPFPLPSPALPVVRLSYGSSSLSQLQHQGPFPAGPWQGYLLPPREGEDTVLLAFCASKNSVMSPNSLTRTGFKVTAGMGAGAGRFWEPHGGDDPSLSRFWVTEVLGFGPVHEHSPGPLETVQLGFQTANQGLSDQAMAHPRGRLGMGAREDRLTRGRHGDVERGDGSRGVSCCQPAAGPPAWAPLSHLGSSPTFATS